MELISENTIRKIDSLGRVSIPKGLRNRMMIEPNDELMFYTLRDNGKDYICCGKADERARYEILADLCEELGVKIPQEVVDKLS
jgi:AbrB family looped-hinge helix DNA binding protein